MKLKDAWALLVENIMPEFGIIRKLRSLENTTVAEGGLPCGMSNCDDYEYMFNRSGDKEVSPLVEKLIEIESRSYLVEPRIEQLADIIWRRFYRNWVQRYQSYFEKDYEPLENYNMQETVSPDITRVRSPDLTDTETPDITRTRSPNLTDTETPNVTVENANSQNDGIYGFNSAASVGANTTAGTGSTTERGTRKTERTGTETDTETGTREMKRTGTETNTETGTTTTQRHGNIGVTTSQQMLQSELDLRVYDYVQSVYADIDTVLCCPLYA